VKPAQLRTEGAVIKLAAVAPEKQSGYEILVAEDNPTNRKVLQKILERAGHRCTLVKDGHEALDLVERKSFDAIILDMNMPTIPGTDVARLYRLMHGHAADLPIIMFSANATPEARQESLDAGANAFLAKPIQIDMFLGTLDRLVQQFHAIHPPLTKLKNMSHSNAVLLTRANEPILNMQALSDLENVSKDRIFLDDLIIETSQALETAHTYTNILSSSLDAFASIISNNQNEVLKRLTTLTIFLSIPVLIASIYGMNVPLPFQHSPYAFWIPVMICFFILGFALFNYVRRIKK
jgi:CheY-like chemotaxis protein